jgi:hypothetical protein
MLTSAVTTGHVMSMDELANVKGRGWEDIDVRGMSSFLFARLERQLTYCAALIMRVRRSSVHARYSTIGLHARSTQVATTSAQQIRSNGLECRPRRQIRDYVEMESYYALIIPMEVVE